MQHRCGEFGQQDEAFISVNRYIGDLGCPRETPKNSAAFVAIG
jgi:hypothetical protein